MKDEEILRRVGDEAVAAGDFKAVFQGFEGGNGVEQHRAQPGHFGLFIGGADRGWHVGLVDVGHGGPTGHPHEGGSVILDDVSGGQAGQAPDVGQVGGQAGVGHGATGQVGGVEGGQVDSAGGR